MRWLPLLLIILTMPLTSCSKEPDFDKEFAAQEKQLDADMKKLDAELKAELAKEPGETEPIKKLH